MLGKVARNCDPILLRARGGFGGLPPLSPPPCRSIPALRVSPARVAIESNAPETPFTRAACGLRAGRRIKKKERGKEKRKKKYGDTALYVREHKREAATFPNRYTRAYAVHWCGQKQRPVPPPLHAFFPLLDNYISVQPINYCLYQRRPMCVRQCPTVFKGRFSFLISMRQ